MCYYCSMGCGGLWAIEFLHAFDKVTYSVSYIYQAVRLCIKLTRVMTLPPPPLPLEPGVEPARWTLFQIFSRHGRPLPPIKGPCCCIHLISLWYQKGITKSMMCVWFLCFLGQYVHPSVEGALCLWGNDVFFLLVHSCSALWQFNPWLGLLPLTFP